MADHSETHDHGHDDGHGHEHGYTAVADHGVGVEAHIEVAAEHGDSGHGGHETPGLTDPNVPLIILVWVTFALLLAILYKYAWKPILAQLEQREQSIRKSVDDAERLTAELAKLEASRATIIAEADNKAKTIISTARKAAVDAAHIIEEKARDDAKILLENAQREIAAAEEKATARLRHESAQLAVNLAGKIIGENLDNDKNRALVDKLIKQV